ncbi:hypothetical protein WUBG_16721, partial [Wuchereria bancrofti]
MWSPQDNFGTPLYYHIRYGPAKMQGIPPLASWTIASLHEIKTIGNSTTLQLHIVPDIDYGIQICAVYSEHRKQPKFELMRVIPFICTSCKITQIAPQCTDVIDIWGYGSNATIMWSPQDNFGTPLYYHIRYGPAKMQ